MKKVLVTGGAGFIGSHIVDALIGNGHSVAVLDNLSTGNQKNVNGQARLHKGDIRVDSEEVLQKEKPEYVIHLAAQANVRKSCDDPLGDAEQNIIGSIALFKACQMHGVKKIVFASSGGTVYGNAERFPAREDFKLKPASPYGIAKAALELYLNFFHNKSGIGYVALRYGNVYGPRQNPKGEAGVVAVFIDKLLRNEPPCIWGSGEQTRDFVYITDVVEATISAMDYDKECKAFNIGTGIETSINAVHSELADVFSFHAHCHNDSYIEDVPRVCLDSSLARHELGYMPKVILEEGIARTVEWFRSKGGIK